MSILIGETVVSMHTLIIVLQADLLWTTPLRHGRREASVTLCLLCNIKESAAYICLIYREKEKEKHLLSKEMTIQKA